MHFWRIYLLLDGQKSTERKIQRLQKQVTDQNEKHIELASRFELTQQEVNPLALQGLGGHSRASMSKWMFINRQRKILTKDDTKPVPKGKASLKKFSAAPSFQQELYTNYVFNESQIKAIQKIYRTDLPLKTSAFPQDTNTVVKVSQEFEDLLEVPKIGSFVEYYQQQKHESARDGYKIKFFRETEKELCRIQNAAKYGIMTSCLTQNALFNQMELHAVIMEGAGFDLRCHV